MNHGLCQLDEIIEERRGLAHAAIGLASVEGHVARCHLALAPTGWQGGLAVALDEPADLGADGEHGQDLLLRQRSAVDRREEPHRDGFLLCLLGGCLLMGLPNANLGGCSWPELRRPLRRTGYAPARGRGAGGPWRRAGSEPGMQGARVLHALVRHTDATDSRSDGGLQRLQRRALAFVVLGLLFEAELVECGLVDTGDTRSH
mmetsp:Transcript_102356/g.330104  ORF Transcript_102356/g.330104 Transcript_102356/m.330104 type:complete len:203 (+) Transcript_102356:1517-2125(+)